MTASSCSSAARTPGDGCTPFTRPPPIHVRISDRTVHGTARLIPRRGAAHAQALHALRSRQPALHLADPDRLLAIQLTA